MDKPIKPIETLAEEFGGLKENFTEDKIETGYQPDVPDILAGANLNYLLDTLGKKFKYNDAISDYIKNMPIENMPIVDNNNKLVYTNDVSFKSKNETISGTKTFATIPSVPTAPEGSKDLKTANTEFVQKELEAKQGVLTAGDNIEIVDNVISAKSSAVIGEIISVACGSDYVPDGCLPCDGAEYSKAQFPALFNSYLATNLLNTCTYEEYATDLKTYGQCGKFGVTRTYNLNCSNDDLLITGEYNNDEAKIFTYNNSGTTTINENVVLNNLIPANGVVNDFSLSSYLEIQNNITEDVSTTFVISLITGNDIETNQGIVGSDMSIAISGGSLGYNSLYGAGEFKPVVTISQNQHILIKIITGEDSDEVYYSLNGGVSWKMLNADMYFSVADNKYIWGKGVIGTGESSGTQATYPFLGSIDLSQSYFIENGVIIPFCRLGTWTPNIEDNGLVVYGLPNDGDSITVSNIAGKFKVPLIKDGAVIQQALSDREIGKAYNAGLPNINGTFSAFYLWGEGSASGAFKFTRKGNGSVGSTGAPWYTYTATMDASNSSSIYGNSDTVQPNAVALRYFVVVANGQINESMMDWSAWASGLQSKLNKDHSNDEKPYVTEMYENGSSGYVLYSNGYCEQWGKAARSAASDTVTLLKPYKNVDYNLQISPYHTTLSTDGRPPLIYETSKIADSFVFNLYTSYSGVYWKTSGYIS